MTEINCPEYQICRLSNYHRCLVIQERCPIREGFRKLEFSIKHEEESVWSNTSGMDFDEMQRMEVKKA